MNLRSNRYEFTEARTRRECITLAIKVARYGKTPFVIPVLCQQVLS
jgi:hypothetical protein